MTKKIVGIILSVLAVILALYHVITGEISTLSPELYVGYAVLLIVGIVLIIAGKNKGKE